MPMKTCSIRTRQRNQFLEVTSQVAEFVAQSGVQSGVVTVFVPHTTAGVTINENADPDVVHDFLMTLEQIFPQHRPGYRHAEGNSDSHLKASYVGSSVAVLVDQGRLQLGTWQGIFFCEFDGPRTRQYFMHIQ